MSCRPFIADPVHLAAVNGERYVVLRPVGAVADAYRQLRPTVEHLLAGQNVSCPAEPHVTLAGFGPCPVEAVRRVVETWACQATPLRVEIERVTTFPSPFQVVVIVIRRTPELFDALSTIRARGLEAGLHDLAVIRPEDWTFHLSVAYCSEMHRSAWADIEREVASL